MAVQLPLTGVRAVVQDYHVFKAQMNEVNRVIAESGKASKTAGQEADKSGGGWQNLAAKIYVAKNALQFAARAFQEVGQFAIRGAQVEGVAEAFNNITRSSGVLAQTLLGELRTAARNTVADFELMRLTNVALAGSTGEFAKQFGENLPKLLEIARVQARATGGDVGFLFQSLVMGIKRTSPLLIDNTGLVLKVGQATEQYAESIGKTAEQLTTEERQIALLNATLEAGNIALQQAGEQQLSVAEKAAQAAATVTNVIDTLSVSLQPIFSAILDGINGILRFIQGLVQAAAPYIRAFAEIIGEGLRIIGGLFSSFIGEVNVGQIAKDFFQGAFGLIGNFANGILFAANKLILPAVTSIAKLIADFLLSFSPVPRGPLHFMRQGGENLMGEYVAGMFGGLQPIQEVAAQVDAMLGQIGKASRPQIEARLRQLDLALRPFEERVKIISAELDALREPAEAALRAIDRQMEGLMGALSQGDAAAAERLRILDAQRDAIQGALDGQQQLADFAQIQLGLARGQQAQERAALEIARDRLPTLQRIRQATDAISEAAGTRPRPAGSGEAPTPATAAVTPPDIGAGAPVDFFGGQGAVDTARQDMTDAFFAPIVASGSLEEFESKATDAAFQFNRIGEGASNIGNKLSGVGDSIKRHLVDPIKGHIDTIINWFTNADEEGTLAYTFKNLTLKLQEFLLDPGGWFKEYVVFPVSQQILSLVDWFSNPEHEGGLLWAFANVRTWIEERVGDLGAWFDETLFGPVRMWISGEGGGGLPGLIQSIVDFFAGLPQAIATALKGLGLFVWNAIAVPVINVINALIDAVETGLNFILSVVLGSESFSSQLAALMPPDLAAKLQTSSKGQVQIGRISLDPPAFLTGGKTGGLFGPGFMRVHKGEEVIGSSSKMAVFPQNFVTSIQGLTGVMSQLLAQPAQMMIPAGNNYSDDHSINATFNGVSGSDDAMRRMAMLKARR